MARYSETNSERKRQSESDPSKAVELSSLVERLARVAALPPPVPPSSSCAPPTTPPGFSPFFNGCTIAHPFWIYGSSYGYNKSSSPCPPAPTCVGHTGLLGPRRKSPRKLVMMILFAFEVRCFMFFVDPMLCLSLFFILPVRREFVLCRGQMSFILCPGRYS